MDRLETPVLLLIFNRPDLAAVTIQRIREVKPLRFFIAADGPRENHAEDSIRCEQARKVVLSMIDWECDVKTLFRDENLGCGLAVSNAISWFFTHVEEGIILEDDCLPIPFFFQYTQTLLKKYRNSGHIMHISGNNFLTRMNTPFDIFFSKYPHSWGWATWRNRWLLYQFELPSNSEVDKELQHYDFLTRNSRKYWADVFMKTKSGIINTWDYQWFYAIWRNNGVCVIPRYNLVVNIGFQENATHTKTNDERFRSITTREFILKEFPPDESANSLFDKEFFNVYLKKRVNLKILIKKMMGI